MFDLHRSHDDLVRRLWPLLYAAFRDDWAVAEMIGQSRPVVGRRLQPKRNADSRRDQHEGDGQQQPQRQRHRRPSPAHTVDNGRQRRARYPSVCPTVLSPALTVPISSSPPEPPGSAYHPAGGEVGTRTLHSIDSNVRNWSAQTASAGQITVANPMGLAADQASARGHPATETRRRSARHPRKRHSSAWTDT